MTTKLELRQWFDEGVQQGATHMIVACDTYDYEDYPVYVMPSQDAQQVLTNQSAQPMTRIMEVYDLRGDKEAQMAEERSYHL